MSDFLSMSVHADWRLFLKERAPKIVKLRDAPERNAALIWVFSKSGPVSHRPWNFGTFRALFRKLFLKKPFVQFCAIIYQNFWKKYPFLYLVNSPPPLFTQNSKIVGPQKKCPKTLGSARNPPPPPLIENTQIKAVLF